MPKTESNVESITFDSLRKRAEECMENERFDDALTYFQRAIALNPDFAEGHCRIGSLLMQKGDYQEAERYLHLSLNKDENLLEAYFNLGVLYQIQGEFEKAMPFYKEVVLRDSEDGEAYKQLGVCCQSLGKDEDARIFFEEAIRLRPHVLDIGTRLAGLYIKQQEFAKAEDILRLSLISHPEEVALHFTLGLVLKAQKKYESALAHFTKIIQAMESHSDAFFHMGSCCYELSLYKQAEPFFAKAYQLDNSFIEPVFLLGRVYEELKKPESAAVMYREWVGRIEDRLSDADPVLRERFEEACSWLEAYYRDLGEEAEAGAIHEKAVACLSGGEKPVAGIGTGTGDYRMSLQIDN